MASKQIKGSDSGNLKKFIIASMKDKLHHTKGTAKELKRIKSLIIEQSEEMKNKKMPENLEVSGYLLIFAEKV